MRGRFLIKVCFFPIYNCPVILGYFLRWVYLILVNLRNFNPRKIQFFVSFLCKTIFPPLTHRARLISKDVEFYCASFDIYEKFAGECPPTQTPTQKLKSGFSIFNSQGMGLSLVWLKMIFEVLQSELFRFKFHFLG